MILMQPSCRIVFIVMKVLVVWDTKNHLLRPEPALARLCVVGSVLLCENRGAVSGFSMGRDVFQTVAILYSRKS